MKKIKKYLGFAIEIIIFIFALAVFAYSGYKIATYYHLLPAKISAQESCGSCSSCLDSNWPSDFCQKIKEWCWSHCPCRPTSTPTPVPQPTTTPEPTSTPIPLTPSPTLPPITPSVSPTNTPALSPSPSPIPALKPTSTPVPASSGEVGGVSTSSGGGGPAYPCTPPEAPKIPTLLSAVSVSSNEIKLTWTKEDRADHYAIAYGTSSGNYLFGNPNVGNTDSYIVGNLTSGQTYYFVVSAAIGGDCPVASGYSNELSAKAGVGGKVAGAKAVSQKAKEEIPEQKQGELNGGISTAAGEVAGITQKACPFWWIVLLGQTILLSGYYGFLLKRKKPPKRWWLAAPALVVVAYLVDHYAHTHWYTPSKMCPWEKWIGIGLAGLETIGYQKLRKKESK